MTPEFTSDWFTHVAPSWEKHIVPAWKGWPCQWLEIGSFEGRSALWTLDNILTHPDSRITCVDVWRSAETAKRFDQNTEGRAKLTRIKGDSNKVLRTMGLLPLFDVIYIDGDHRAKSVITDAVLAWALLRKGGTMIFDDYRWEFKEEERRLNEVPVRYAVDAFLSWWKDELSIVHKDYQVIVKKI
jgi:predicted O-methyltransferase YrrM